MTTHVGVLVETLTQRLSEVDALLQLAEIGGTESPQHAPLCRAAVVLLSAHMEGFSRDLVRAIIKDVNAGLDFGAAPEAMQRTYTDSFLGHMTQGREAYQAQDRLRRVFAASKTLFSPEPFLAVAENEEKSRNPTPAVLTRMLQNFGVKRFFLRLTESDLDEFFTGSPHNVDVTLSLLRSHVTHACRGFPYDVQEFLFSIRSTNDGVDGGQRTLWEEWVDGLLVARHEVAHGKSVDNKWSLAELRSFRAGTELLLLAVVAILCAHVQAHKPNA